MSAIRPIDLREYRHHRGPERIAERRLARRLLLEAIHLDIPNLPTHRGERYVGLFVDEPGEMPPTLIALPGISDFELRLFAWGAAVRMVRKGGKDDPSVGWTRSRLREIADLMGPDPELTLAYAMGEAEQN